MGLIRFQALSLTSSHATWALRDWVHNGGWRMDSGLNLAKQRLKVIGSSLNKDVYGVCVCVCVSKIIIRAPLQRDGCCVCLVCVCVCVCVCATDVYGHHL